jgi:hypothetical protein
MSARGVFHLICGRELDHSAASAAAVAGRQDIGIQHLSSLLEMILQILPSCLPAQIANINSATWFTRAAAHTRHLSTPIRPFIRQRKIHICATSVISQSHPPTFLASLSFKLPVRIASSPSLQYQRGSYTLLPPPPPPPLPGGGGGTPRGKPEARCLRSCATPLGAWVKSISLLKVGSDEEWERWPVTGVRRCETVTPRPWKTDDSVMIQ